MNSRNKIVLFLGIVGIFLHFSYLSHPDSVVFDEVHFGKFISSYCCTGVNFFDIHPPHAKLLIAGAAKVAGYDGQFAFSNISDAYEQVPIGAMRFFPAVWGTLLPIVFFYFLSLLGVGTSVAFLGSGFLLLDNALLVQTRVIALDGLLLVSIFSSLIFYLLSRRTGHWAKKIGLWSLSGAMAGFAVGTKFTGLVAPALILGIVASELWKNLNRGSVKLALRKLLWVNASLVAVYLIGWVIHFQLLDQPGWGNQFYTNSGDFFEDFIKLHQVMFDRNASITTPHSDASHWWQWPFMLTPIYYWSASDADIYFLGNPIVWWGINLTFALLVLRLLFNHTNSLNKKNIWLPLAGFLISFLPFVAVSRPLFLYHYLTPLLFALSASLIGFERWFEKKKVYSCAWAMMIAGFIFISPLTFGLSKTHFWGEWIFKLFPGWR